MANFNGTNGNDTLRGGDGNDSITGRGGNDWMYGGYGNDRLYGGEGNDHMFGGGGLDTDHNEPGARNVLEGGPGNDSLAAGEGGGEDRFVFGPGHGHDLVFGAWGSAVRARWYGDNDKIDLSDFGGRAPTWAQIQTRLTIVTAENSDGYARSSVRLDLSDFGGGSITFYNTQRQYIDESDFIGLSGGTGPVTNVDDPPPPSEEPETPRRTGRTGRNRPGDEHGRRYGRRRHTQGHGGRRHHQLR